MKISLQINERGYSQIMTIQHMKGVVSHNPDLLEFGRYCEDLLHKTRFSLEGFEVVFEIKDRLREFAAYTTNKKLSRVIFNYFNGGKYELDRGYDDVGRIFYIVGVENDDR